MARSRPPSGGDPGLGPGQSFLSAVHVNLERGQPQALVSAFERFEGTLGIDFVRSLRPLGEDTDAIGEYFNSPAIDSQMLFSALLDCICQHAGTHFSKQWRVPGQDARISGGKRQLDGDGILVENKLVRDGDFQAYGVLVHRDRSGAEHGPPLGASGRNI